MRLGPGTVPGCRGARLILHHPSPNHGPRRGGALPRLVVLHYTVLNLADSLARLCDPVPEVSAHYVIAEDGRVFHLVEEERRAWHAGPGRWGDCTDVNSASVGIEIVNSSEHPYPEPQMAALEALLPGILARHGIAPKGVIAHSDMAPRRKRDPGPRFDWRRLARAGLSVWPATVAAPVSGLDAALITFGYDPELTAEERLATFRLRFRPWARGPADETDAGMAHDLARRFPVDRPGPPA